MPLLAVPHDLQVWLERVDPRTRIVLDHWDSDAELYTFHDLDHPAHRGDISPNVLDACYRPVGSVARVSAVHSPVRST